LLLALKLLLYYTDFKN